MTEAPVNLREVGRLRVLQALHETGLSSRTELARLTGLSRATVASLVADLVTVGLVREDAPSSQDRSTGRPASALGLVPSAAYAVGVDIGHEHVRVAICDLRGAQIWNTMVPTEVDRASGETLDLAAELIGVALRDSGIDREDVLGLGVDIAAPVRRSSGALEAHGILPGWVGVRPGVELERRTGLRTRLTNDANAGALAEHRYGAGRGVDDMVYVRLSAGIGAGIITRGRALTGSHGLSGEIGHLRTGADGPICRCGNRGCLETVASPTAIARLLETSWGRPVAATDLPGLIAEDNRGAIRAVEDAAEHIGRVLAHLVTVLNPELIIVGGDLAAAGEHLFEPIRRGIARDALAPSAGTVTVVRGELGDGAEVLGAAATVLADAPKLLGQRST